MRIFCVCLAIWASLRRFGKINWILRHEGSGIVWSLEILYFGSENSFRFIDSQWVNAGSAYTLSSSCATPKMNHYSLRASSKMLFWEISQRFSWWQQHQTSPFVLLESSCYCMTTLEITKKDDARRSAFRENGYSFCCSLISTWDSDHRGASFDNGGMWDRWPFDFNALNSLSYAARRSVCPITCSGESIHLWAWHALETLTRCQCLRQFVACWIVVVLFSSACEETPWTIILECPSGKRPSMAREKKQELNEW